MIYKGLGLNTDKHSRIYEALTQEEMAEVLGISKRAQQKLERRLFEKLRSEFEKRGVSCAEFLASIR
jgi:hypothetical protein